MSPDPGELAGAPDAAPPREVGADAAAPDAAAPRATDGLLVLYRFDELGGDLVRDRSGIGEPLDLTVADPGAVQWTGDSLVLASPTLITSRVPATKIILAAKASRALTIELWATPGNLEQAGPARLVTCSIDTAERNFQVGQKAADDLEVRLRTSASNANGAPYLATPTGGGDVKTALTHIVFTLDPAGARRIYVDGALRSQDSVAGDLSTWDETFPLHLANEQTGGRAWLGAYHLLAIYDRALDGAEVSQHFLAGP